MSNLTKRRVSTQRFRLFQLLLALVFLFSLVGAQPAQEALAQTETKVALITDWGVNISDPTKAAIATLIKNWAPEAVVTAGDNYHDRTPPCSSYAECVAGYNSYTTGYTDFVTSGHFYPAYGNHDAGHSAAYKAYFSDLPTNPDPNRLYYDKVVGYIHFWFLNGNEKIDGSAQEAWLETNVPNSTSPWNIVIVHQPPYGTGFYGDSDGTGIFRDDTIIDYAGLGIDFVIGGHNHHYERLVKDGVRYFIAGRAGNTSDSRTCDGTGSDATTEFCAGTRNPPHDSYGYMQITANETEISLKFIDDENKEIDKWEQNTGKPSLSIDPTALNFTSEAGVASDIKSYTVSGVRLQGNVTITPPADFEISTVGGAGFTPVNPIILIPTSGTLGDNTIYARFNRATAGISTGDISHTSLDAPTGNLAVTGTASQPQQFTVTFDPNGGTTPAPPTKVVTLNAVYGTLATTTRMGYIFTGWFTAPTDGAKVTADTTVTTASNHTLYAQWETFTVFLPLILR